MKRRIHGLVGAMAESDPSSMSRAWKAFRMVWYRASRCVRSLLMVSRCLKSPNDAQKPKANQQGQNAGENEFCGHFVFEILWNFQNLQPQNPPK